MKAAHFFGSAIVGVALVFSLSAARAADFVVVEARGIALKPGETVDGAKPLALRQGQHVTLISEDGTTLKLDGPYDRPPAAAGTASVTLASVMRPLISGAGPRTNEVGVVRGAPAPRALPDPWLLDIDRAGNVCLRDGQPPQLWRAHAARTATLTIWPSDRSWKAEATWPAGDNRLLVPASVPLRTGATYLVSLGGPDMAITLNAVPAVLANNAMRAAWLVQKGCEAQAEALLRKP